MVKILKQPDSTIFDDWQHPWLCGYHFGDGPPAFPEYHVLFYTNNFLFFLFPDFAMPCPYDPDNPPLFGEITPEMIHTAELCYANPSIICDMCYVCNQRFGVSRTGRWNIIRDGQYQYRHPAQRWDESVIGWDGVEFPIAYF